MRTPAITILLVCATSFCFAQSLSPGERITTEFLDVSTPPAPGWQISTKSPAHIAIARGGSQPDETFAAFAIIFRLEQPRDRAHFLELIREGVAADTSPDRFRELKADFQHDESRGYPCIRYSAVYEDTRARLRSGGAGTLTLQALALYCLHPKQQGAAFAFGYSHRGQELHAAFEAEAGQFISSGNVRGR